MQLVCPDPMPLPPQSRASATREESRVDRPGDLVDIDRRELDIRSRLERRLDVPVSECEGVELLAKSKAAVI
jgi:hypothetical protein